MMANKPSQGMSGHCSLEWMAVDQWEVATGAAAEILFSIN
jgi:hypothetical protein